MLLLGGCSSEIFMCNDLFFGELSKSTDLQMLCLAYLN